MPMSEYDPSLGRVVRSPGLVNDLYSGCDHCVSELVIHALCSSEGDAGTLQHVLNNLVNDNGVSFVTSVNVPGKQQAVSVIQIGCIKTKGLCTLNHIENSPATCTGEYELLYEVTFDAVHSSGNIPPLTVVMSDFRLDTTSSAYGSAMCPTSHFVHGCEEPTGAALDSDHGSFYSLQLSQRRDCSLLA
jgi:hypothetical protein